MKIAWIGLGEIGTRMVRRLLAAGHDVTVFARGAGLAEVQAAGASIQSDYAALAAASELLTLCVYTDEQVRGILFDNGALGAMQPGSILAIHTTGSPAVTLDAGRRAPSGVSVLDASFSAGPDDISSGKAIVMVGGDVEALDRARPAFSAYAGEIHHVGPLGAGRTIKLFNNLVFAANLMNTAELLKLAGRQGLDTQMIARVLQGCSGGSYAMRMFQAAPVDDMMSRARPYLEKDVSVAIETAKEGGLDVSAFAATAAYFQTRK